MCAPKTTWPMGWFITPIVINPVSFFCEAIYRDYTPNLQTGTLFSGAMLASGRVELSLFCSADSKLGFASSMIEKSKSISPNGGLMVIYHGKKGQNFLKQIQWTEPPTFCVHQPTVDWIVSTQNAIQAVLMEHTQARWPRWPVRLSEGFYTFFTQLRRPNWEGLL